MAHFRSQIEHVDSTPNGKQVTLSYADPGGHQLSVSVTVQKSKTDQPDNSVNAALSVMLCALLKSEITPEEIIDRIVSGDKPHLQMQ